MFESMTALLPRRLQPYAKALYPLLATLIAVLASWIETGTFDEAETRTAISGAVLSLLAWAPPNNPGAGEPYVEPAPTGAAGPATQ